MTPTEFTKSLTSQPQSITNAAWQSAFNLYNQYSGQPPLKPGCRPCYGRVYAWLLKDTVTQEQLDNELST